MAGGLRAVLVFCSLLLKMRTWPSAAYLGRLYGFQIFNYAYRDVIVLERFPLE